MKNKSIALFALMSCIATGLQAGHHKDHDKKDHEKKEDQSRHDRERDKREKERRDTVEGMGGQYDPKGAKEHPWDYNMGESP